MIENSTRQADLNQEQLYLSTLPTPLLLPLKYPFSHITSCWLNFSDLFAKWVCEKHSVCRKFQLRQIENGDDFIKHLFHSIL